MPFPSRRSPLFEAQTQFTNAPLDRIEALFAPEQEEAGLLTQPTGRLMQLEEGKIEQQWDLHHDEEGELALDVYETDAELIVIAAIAGVRADDLQLTLQQDMLTVRGRRKLPHLLDAAIALVEECYWGAFSRTLILPTAVDPSTVNAKLAGGVLTVRLKKIASSDIPVVELVDEEESL